VLSPKELALTTGANGTAQSVSTTKTPKGVGTTEPPAPEQAPQERPES
jgi:cell division protease FtsH